MTFWTLTDDSAVRRMQDLAQEVLRQAALGGGFLISRSVGGPGCQGPRGSAKKQKQKTGALMGARVPKDRQA